jgi:hypothetical protein
MSRVKVSINEKVFFFFRTTYQRAPLLLTAILTSFQSGCQESDPAPNTYRDSIPPMAELQALVLGIAI